jgi:hypothetical protein
MVGKIGEKQGISWDENAIDTPWRKIGFFDL